MGPDIELSPWQDFLTPHFFLKANTSVATTSSDASPFRQVIWELSVSDQRNSSRTWGQPCQTSPVSTKPHRSAMGPRGT